MSDIVTADLATREEAARGTELIRAARDTAAAALDRLASRISDAYARRYDLALGYESWQDYAAEEFGEHTKGLAPAIRRELVGVLAGDGMSTRAIAPAVGASQKTVSRDVQVSHGDSPAPTAPVRLGMEDIEVDVVTGEILDDAQDEDDRETFGPTSPWGADLLNPEDDDPEPKPRRVTGLDGKSYAAPTREPATPRRPALTDQFFNAIYDLGRKAERLAALTEDDRFPQNKEKAAARNRSDLLRTIDTLQRVADRLA